VTVLAFDLESLAQIIIFAAIALGALIKRILESRRGGAPPPETHEDEHDGEREEEEHEHPAPRRHEEPAHRHPVPHHRGPRAPSPPPRPHPAPEPAGDRAPGALGGLPAVPAHERGRLTDFEKTRLHFGEPQPSAPPPVARRPAEVVGRALLFGRDLSPRDRVRSALLWREVLEPPPSLSDPR
jgi:hypothetical protein